MNDTPPHVHIPFRSITEGASTSGYVNMLIAFLENYLPSFPLERTVDVGMNENDITEQLYKHLTRKAKFNAEEKEYVSGNGGAIERFKSEAHGLDDAGNLLPRNGIVAYVTADNYNSWHNRINAWINELEWGKSERLILEYAAPIGKLKSGHNRISGQPLELNHFWVDISSGKRS